MSKSINLVDFDFNSLKSDLIEFLKSQPLYKDYDFSGSNLNVLMDLLAYNTQKHAFLSNMLFSEAHIDSAQLNSSVISRAKNLNYVPRSARSSQARITCTFEASAENQPYVIQKGQSFSTLVKNDQYVFSLPNSIIVSSANNTFTFETDIYEGIYVKDTYIFKTTERVPYPSFKITNKNIDTTSLTVAVYEDNSTVPVSYNLATSLLGLNENSKVYFLQVGSNGFYEIMFGDGVLGYKPKENSSILLDYRISSLNKPNGASNFVINFDPTGNESELTNTPTTTTVTNAFGGDVPEDIESIRYYAPRYFQTQERAIIPSDYEVMLKTRFPEIEAISAYGGEEADPPQFGKVIITPYLPGFSTIPDSKKQKYYDFIKPRCPMIPVFADPQFSYIAIDTLVRYNINLTSATADRIKSLVVNTIETYNNNILNDFNVILRLSNLISQIDSTDQSIISNQTTIKLYKKLYPLVGSVVNLVIPFDIELISNFSSTQSTHNLNIQKTLTSTRFMYKGSLSQFEDDGNGNVRIVQFQGDVVTSVSDIGTIDYKTGLIVISNMVFDSYENNVLKIYVTPKDDDVYCKKNTIMTIESSEINTTIEAISQ